MATNITFTDASDQPSPLVSPQGQQREFTDATSGKIMLSAVNRILEGIGEMPVTAMDPGTDSLAGDAQRMLEEQTKEILVERWHCNTVASKLFTAGTDGRVSLEDVLSFASPVGSDGRYALVSGYLYDREDQTDTFAVGATFTLRDVVMSIPFSAMPEPLRRHAMTAAAVRFAATKFGDRDQLRYLSEVAEQARQAATRFDGDQRQVNLFQGYDALQIKGIIPRRTI